MVKSPPKGRKPKHSNSMVLANTPIEDYRKEWGLWIKREDLACPPPGPPFSKTRGVFTRVMSRPEDVIGVLDTRHSQAGHAVARACQILGKRCLNFYPEYKHEPGHRLPQERAKKLGATLVGIPAGRSCILFNHARKATEEQDGYMMPNALKLDESVTETAKEVPEETNYDYVLIPASSGTIAAGVVRGFRQDGRNPTFIIHLGYSRSHDEVKRYIQEKAGYSSRLLLVDEKYEYKDVARPGPTPPWPCNEYYDLKAFRWFQANRKVYAGRSVLMWNIG